MLVTFAGTSSRYYNSSPPVLGSPSPEQPNPQEKLRCTVEISQENVWEICGACGGPCCKHAQLLRRRLPMCHHVSRANMEKHGKATCIYLSSIKYGKRDVSRDWRHIVDSWTTASTSSTCTRRGRANPKEACVCRNMPLLRPPFYLHHNSICLSDWTLPACSASI